MKTKMVTMTIGLFLSAATVFGTEGDDRFYGGSYDGEGSAMMQHARALDDGPQVSLWSAPGQVFDWTAGSTALATLTVAVWEPHGAVTNGGTLRVNVPTAWQCRFDAGAAAAFGGSAASKVGAASYSGDGRILTIPVTADFVDNDTLTIAGLKVANLRLSRAGTQWLGLDFEGNTAQDVCDEYALTVNAILWRGGAYDGGSLATSEAMSFWTPKGTFLSIH